MNLYDPILAPDGAVADKFGSSATGAGSPSGRGPTYVPAPDGWSFSLALNAGRPASG